MFIKILKTFGIFMLSQLPSALLGVIVALDIPTTTSITVVISLSFLLVTALLIYFAYKDNLFNIKKFNKHDVVKVIISFVAILVLSALASKFIGTETPKNQEMIDQLFQNTSKIIMMFMVLTAAFTEEIIMRGYVQGVIFEKRPLLGLIVATLIFAGLHVQSASAPSELIVYLIPSIVLGTLYYRTRKLENTILLHFINNFIALLGLMGLS